MKFLVISSFPDSVVAFRGHLIRSVIQSGYDVVVAAPGLVEGSKVQRELQELGADVVDIPLRRTSTSPLHDVALLFALYRLMRQLQPRAVLGYTIKPVIYGTLAAWLARIPRRFVLVTGLGYIFTGARSGFVMSVVRALYRLALGRAEIVFFQNPDDRELLLDSGILSRKTRSVVVNGSGINIDEFTVRPLPSSTTKFLMIARLLGDKGVREYAEAARLVSSRQESVRFALVGWIDENPDAVTSEELDSWTKEGFIEFLGRLDDVRPAIADCSVYVLPSYREGTPRTVLEAMAMGRAIITTDAPGCRETVRDEYNGFLVAPRSYLELADAMEKLVVNRDLVIKFGRRSRVLAEEKYDVRKVSAQMLNEMQISDEKIL